jgi:hypothetical protein
MMKSLRAIVSILVLTVFSTAIAQQTVAPPPKPANDAPANAEVLMLLRAGMSESVVLNKIHATTDKFDTSADALVTLKQAGANDAELSAVLAQGASPAAQQPTGNGPSLADTMQFIQDKLSSLSNVSFIVFLQNTSDGFTGTSKRIHELSNVVANQNLCSISDHEKLTANGNTVYDLSELFLLRDIQEIVVKPEEQLETEWNARTGSADNIITSTSPPITTLIARGTKNAEHIFRFTDANLADRVAKAMLHAVELCGGGSKDKF